MGRTSRAFLSTVFALVLAIGLVPVAQAEPSSTTSTASDTQQATESSASQQSDSLTVQSTKDVNDPSIQVMGLGDKLWTGSAITPYITVLDTHPLTQGTDYEVSYSNNINVGQARVTITGMGNYTGTRTELFNIVNQQPISNCTITVGSAVYYGDLVTPQVTVTTPSGKTLTENYEYTVAYSGNTGVGTGTVTVTATDSTSGSTNLYTGSATKQFTITQGQTTIAGSGTESDPYQISTIDDLKFVSHVVNTGKDNCSYASAHYKLMNNIDASAALIDPIGTSSHTSQTSYGFAGTFDGSGHTITMGTASAPSTHALFGYIARNSTSDTLATIKNLTVAGNFTASHTYMTAAAFADAIGTMPVTFTGCTNKASVSAFLAAGFVSSSTSTQLTFNNCTNEGAITATENGDSQADGFVSGSNGTSSSPNNVATFTGCRNAGTITGTHSAAGFAGRVADKQGLISDFVFTNCSNEGTITSSAGNAGGLLGALSGVNYASYTASVKITTSTNSGTISGALNSGGLVGQGTSKLSIDIKDSYNKGSVAASGSSSYAAGLVGGVTDASCALTVTNAYNAGTVAGTNGAGVLGEAGASASAAFTNAYFLNSATKAVASTNSTATVTGSPASKSLDQMKATGTQGMAAALGSAFKDADNDTPLLGWQQGGLVPKTDLSTATLSAISNSTYNGTEQKPEPTVTLAGKQLTANTDFTYSYTSNKDAGTATVTVTGIGSYEGSVNATFTIAPATVTSIDSVDDQTYTGSAITPKPGVHAGGMVLTEGTDFTYSYTNNTQLNSQASVAATAKGNFTGTVSAQFKIVAASITDATVDAIAAQTYTGTAIEPTISVTLKGKQLSNPTDYTVAYSSNVHAGEASITLTGAGNYQGSKTVKFTISPLQAQLAWAGDSSLVYDGAAKNVTASVSNLASSDVCAVTVTGGTESAAGTHTATATALTGTSAGDYVLPADATHTYTIAAASLANASIASIADSAYTGSAITPEPEVTVGGKKLASGTDFDYSYKDNTAAGTATVAITGKGNYQGTASKTFTITTVSTDKLTIQDIADQEYTGSAITPKPVVKLGRILSRKTPTTSFRTRTTRIWELPPR